MKKVVFAAAVLAAIVSATGTASAVSSSVFPITAQEGFIRIAPSDLPQAVRDALDKKYPGSFIEEAYNDATASPVSYTHLFPLWRHSCRTEAR